MASKYPIDSQVDTLKEGVLAGDRIALARAITLIESKRPDDRILAGSLLDLLLPHTGNSLRIGITGVPGVGKSTLIEQFGLFLISAGKRVAVLSIDPSSSISKGSILGDKTRMTELSRKREAFIRPSPAQSTLGGVANATREAMLLCEAAGFDVILVETVGVGQSETAVRGMVDIFVLLMLAGGGDELQGIKRGIMEMADLILINKADGDNLKKAQNASKEMEMALHLLAASTSGWTPQVRSCSSLDQADMPAIWEQMQQYFETVKANGFFEANRRQQTGFWLDELIINQLKTDFYNADANKIKVEHLRHALSTGAISLRHALIQLFPEK